MDIAIAGAGLKLGIEQTKKCQQKITLVQLMLMLGEKWNKTHKAKYQRPNLVWSKLTDPCTDEIKVCLHVCFSMRPGVCCHCPYHTTTHK